jgi:hypothetical protein
MPKTAILSAQSQIRSILVALDLVAPDHFEEHVPSSDIDDPTWVAEVRNSPWRITYSEFVEMTGHSYTFSVHAGKHLVMSLYSPEIRDDGDTDCGGRERWIIQTTRTRELFEADGATGELYLKFFHELCPGLFKYALRVEERAYMSFPLEEVPDAERGNPASPFVLGLIVRILNWYAQLPRNNPPAV